LGGNAAQCALEDQQDVNQPQSSADNRDNFTASTQTSSLSAAETATAPTVIPHDFLSIPIPGKIGGSGALDAGPAGNPSGISPISQASPHPLIASPPLACRVFNL
jgi:hypothetical protein